MNESTNRRYVLTIAALAAAVLALGALLRPEKRPPDAPSSSETASLQITVRRNELGETASYFAQRAQLLAQSVIHDHGHDASAVAWGKPGSVLTTSSPDADSFETPLLVSAGKAGDPPPRYAATPGPGHWLLIIGRTQSGQLLWTPAVYGGAKATTCSGEGYQELMVNARLDSALAGAAAFDLDGVLAGVVADCDGAYHVVSAPDIPRLLDAFQKPERRVQAAYGMTVETPDSPPALLVAEIRLGEPAGSAGLRAGDLITGSKKEAFTKPKELWTALQSEDALARTFEIVRGGKKLSVLMPALRDVEQAGMADSSMGISVLPAQAQGEEIYVTPGTAAYRAGLRTGDRILRIGNKQTAAATDFARAVAAAEDGPLLVIYQRNRVQRAALVTK